ncbi:MAG: SGNH/GDSL hydrolase family protein [Proteobacteria bacterium]|nr:SGNH/GDSL hydrolase family protein [Pseudomonadota bacterium]
MRLKHFIFSLITTLLFFVVLESGVRLFLFLKARDSIFLLHGLVKKGEDPTNRFENVYDAQGNCLYFRTKPSDDEQNPVNTFGFRGPEISKKRPHTKRIVCLGGSTTYGLGLSYGNTYPKLLQNYIDKNSGAGHYEIINAGIPAHKLFHIIEQVKHVILGLEPDIIILMDVFNNLITDAKDFAFIKIEGEEKNLFIKASRKLIKGMRKYSLFVSVSDDIAKKGVRNYLKHWDWQRGSTAIMNSQVVWQKYRSNLHALFSLLTKNNPSISVIVLDEPMNFIDYPELAPPVFKAYDIQKMVSMTYENVHAYNIAEALNNAYKKGEPVWIAPYYDPIHLSRRGNEVIADILGNYILSKDYPAQ